MNTPSRPESGNGAVAASPRRLRDAPVALLLPAAALVAALAVGIAALAGAGDARQAPAAPPAAAPALAVHRVQLAGSAGETAVDGVVEALRQTVVAAQVSGAIVELAVKAGDRVAAGQLLLRIDARAAEQAVAAGDAQLRAALAAQAVAAKELERARKLQDASFISAAALDRAVAEHQAAQAQAAAQLAQAGVARTQGTLHIVRAPYAGVIADVPATLGEMALPGKPLVVLYDPAQLRISAAVPQSALAGGSLDGLRIELPAAPAEQRQQRAQRVQLLPAADAATHTVTLRAELPAGFTGAVPGQFARLWLPGAPSRNPWLPASAVVRRGELTGVYVLDASDRPLLRQVRLGASRGGQVEVLTGLAAGERVALEAPLASRSAVAALR